MNDASLTILKFCLMAVLYLFLARVVWVVASELRIARTRPEIPDPVPAVVAAEPVVEAGRSRRREKRDKSATWTLTTIAPKHVNGQSYVIDGEITIGRAPGCAIRIEDDSFVSSLHARVFVRDGSLYVEDLGSTNGTTVNGGRVATATRLQKRDRIQIGDRVFEARR
jgi:hypothetical protein